MIETLNLQSGSFKIVLPYRWQEWLGYVIFGLVAIFGLLMTIGSIGTSNEELVGGLFVMGVGFLGMAMFTPGSHEKELHEIRKQAIDPAELERRAKESGLTIDNWFLRQTSYVPTNDPNDWILPAPGPASWNSEDRYAPDGDGTPLPEHPVKVGTPIPASMSLYGIFGLIATFSFILGAGAGISSLDKYR